MSKSLGYLILALSLQLAAFSFCKLVAAPVDDVAITQLLEQLDGPTYLERENAMVELSRIGEAALKPMAVHYLNSSPESSWRIRTSLESIATNGNESTFLKSIAILQLLVGTDNLELQTQLARLKSEWATKQTDNAVNELKRAGAIIENYVPLTAFANRFSSTNEVVQFKFQPPARLSKPQQLKLIDKIIAGSTKENRKLVLGSEIKPKANEDEFDVLERQIGNQFLVRNGVVMRIDPSDGVTAKFTSAWKGKKQQFRELENISQLTEVVFNRQKIEAFHLETLGDLDQLNTIELDRCSVSGKAMATVGLPKSLKELRIRNQDIDVATIDRVAKLDLRSIVFDGCDFSKASYRKMFTLTSINSMELANMKLDTTAFERLEKMTNLRSLKLSSCKYAFADYLRLTERRPRIYVDFTTSAFLGVRSIPGVNDVCEISEVVPDSGADRGGVKAGDTITQVNGSPIRHFTDLRAQISLHEDGDTLNMQVSREGETVKLKVVLGNYADAPND